MLKYDLEKHMFGIKKNLTWKKIRNDNLQWWNGVGRRDIKEKPSTKRKNYDVFLEDILKETGLNIKQLDQQVVGEVCCGPYGGIIEGYKIQCKEKYFIDIFMEDFKNMNFINWTNNSSFINAPCEHIHLEDDKLDVLFGYNSIDHGWDWKKSLDECVRISKKTYLMFDTKNEVDGDFHPQKISHKDVLDYVEEKQWSKSFKTVIVKARYKDYGYYETCFDWPETWIYLEKK